MRLAYTIKQTMVSNSRITVTFLKLIQSVSLEIPCISVSCIGSIKKIEYKAKIYRTCISHSGDEDFTSEPLRHLRNGHMRGHEWV